MTKNTQTFCTAVYLLEDGDDLSSLSIEQKKKPGKPWLFAASISDELGRLEAIETALECIDDAYDLKEAIKDLLAAEGDYSSILKEWTDA